MSLSFSLQKAISNKAEESVQQSFTATLPPTKRRSPATSGLHTQAHTHSKLVRERDQKRRSVYCALARETERERRQVTRYILPRQLSLTSSPRTRATTTSGPQPAGMDAPLANRTLDALPSSRDLRPIAPRRSPPSEQWGVKSPAKQGGRFCSPFCL